MESLSSVMFTGVRVPRPLCAIKSQPQVLTRSTRSTRHTVNCRIANFEGQQYTRNGLEYEKYKFQYATPAYPERTEPELIVYPKNVDDIKLAIKYAKAQKVGIAIRTGGHQYSGASSASGKNIQIDLSQTFRDTDKDLQVLVGGPDPTRPRVRTGVCWSLLVFNHFLGEHELFIPHGQCCNVHLGGHVQSGGYGQLGRSFGLMADHVVELEIVNHEGEQEIVTKESNPELFFGILGGSPGNFCVITHFTVAAHRSQDYVGSRGLKKAYVYTPEALKKLYDIIAEDAGNDELPKNYDICITAISDSNKLMDWFSDVRELVDREEKAFVLEEGGQLKLVDDVVDDVGKVVAGVENWVDDRKLLFFGKGKPRSPYPRVIILYAQWVPFGTETAADIEKRDSWFQRLADAGDDLFKGLFDHTVQVKPMHELTSQWTFLNVREFDLPYVKRTYVTKSTTLAEDGWVEWVTGRVNEIMETGDKTGRKIASQIQHFGGKYSQLLNNKDNGTAFSWRDSTITATLDCFHEPTESAKKNAEAWVAVNDKEAHGGNFSKQDMRVFWGSYGNYNLDEVSSAYYDSAEKYKTLCDLKKKVDPDNVFTPNTFCVGAKPAKETVTERIQHTVGEIEAMVEWQNEETKKALDVFTNGKNLVKVGAKVSSH